MINRIIRKINNQKQSFKKYIKISDSSVLQSGFNLDVRFPKNEKVYLEIGSNCIIDGRFIFESKTGHVSIGDYNYIGNSSFISKTSIKTGDFVTIAWGCTIYDHDSHSINYINRRNDILQQLKDIRNKENFIKNKDWNSVNTKQIIIENDAWIGMNVIILKGVTIGEGAVVGAGSVVTKDVPPWTIVAGNPARIVKSIPKELRNSTK